MKKMSQKLHVYSLGDVQGFVVALVDRTRTGSFLTGGEELLFDRVHDKK